MKARMYDAFGPGYTLLRFDSAVDVARFLAAAEERRVPLALVDIEGVRVPPEYRHALVLCRSDQHVAWRGDRVPDAPGRVIDILRGAGTAEVARLQS